MPEQKFDPVKEFVNLRDSIGRAVEQSIKSISGTGTYPPVDVYETPDSIVLRTAFVTGAKPESIQVSMENDLLTISGESIDPLQVADTAYISRELRFGQFTRSIRIPRRVLADEAQAKFTDGILTVTLPKAPAEANSQIIDITPAE
jgi:HSP20 family protein